ncbi:hypothetical protein Ancab_030267 [Ancistrocladus abbreviatus]
MIRVSCAVGSASEKNPSQVCGARPNNASSPSAPECGAVISQASNPELGHDSGLERGRVGDDLSKSTVCKHNVALVTLMPGNGGDVDLCGSIGHGKNGDGHQMSSTAENDFRPLCKIVLDSAVDFQKGFQNKEKLHLDVCGASKASSLKAFVCKRKGMEKALSDGDGDAMSVESCNSGAFHARKRWVLSFEQQLIVGSKRIKQQIQEHPGSTSFTKIDSYFLNQISNMAKSRNQHAQWSNMCFQSFKSFYGPNQKVLDHKMLQADQCAGEVHEQLEFTKKPQYFNAAQVTSGSDDLKPSKSNLFLTARSNQSALGDVEGTMIHSDHSSNRHPYKQASDLEKEQGSLCTFSVVKQKTNSGNNVPVDLGVDYWEPGKSNLLPPTRINQFLLGDGEGQLAHVKMSKENPATCQLDDWTHSGNGYSGKQASDMAKEGQSSNNFRQAKILIGNDASHLQSEVNFRPWGYPSEDPSSAVGINLQNCATDNEAGLSDRVAEVAITCFFCVVRDRDLNECHQTAEIELEELLCNALALDHWAVACANASSRKQQGFKGSAALHNHREMQSQKADIKLLENVDRQIQVAREHAVASNITSRKRVRVSTNLDLEMNATASTSSRLISRKNPNLVDEVAGADYGESIAAVPKFVYPCNAIKGQMLNVPEGTFEAVKELR